MTSFDTTPQLNVWRALLALAVVFVMLATTGWTALRNQRGDTPLQASLSAWEHGRIGGHRLPDPQSQPTKLARFFTSLTERDRASLVRKYPLAVGNMNGAPVELRYRANRVALGQARKVERERMHDSRLTPSGKREAARRMHRFDDLMEKGRHILAFDPEGSGRVAEVFGDLREADRVSVVVPGVDTDLLTFQRTQRKYAAPVGMAESLYAAERTASPSTRTAVIAWADYTAPSGLGIDSATAMRAEEGAVRLNALVRALPGGSPVSLFCHSYGSVVCGVAARSLPGRVSDIAVAGSPGMRAEKAAQLHTTARVWAMRDADDWIQDVPYLELGGLGHGADPVSAGFGARVLSAQGAKGHAGYFEPGTASLMNFAEIGVGAYRSVHCAHEDGVCRTGLSGTAAA
ncbi:pimeloyl-ACP methyl ester carboxylesterase [Streptomyces africanus]|uniref:Pimeloyl-ACP methyl ester carboxylesterase n=1 Tax=Streptomyces africanus TaxID=231024 RepID=A0ABU0QLA7_9ACTN|nr:alpha/beta hydrolase family protein [Streptomyces africanus]MDQ0748157.1 pimeloyl-ACP methyl ester carboxylesterase [Streptomyces africanus]